MSRIVVLGVNGFVGSSITKYLSDKSGFETVGVNRSIADLSNMESLLKCFKIGDIVINAAGYANAVDFSVEGIRKFAESNVVGVQNLANACVTVGVSQLIHFSSVAAMGRLEGLGIREGDLGSPDTPYGQSKRDGELILDEFSSRLAVTILRPTSVFGPGRGLANTLCKIADFGFIPLPRAGEALIPFTAIDNLALAVFLCLNNSSSYGKTFIVGDIQSYSLRHIIETLAHALGKDPVFFTIPGGLDYGGVFVLEKLWLFFGRQPIIDRTRLFSLTHSVSYSIDSIRAAVGYEPSVGLDKAVTQIVGWYHEKRA